MPTANDPAITIRLEPAQFEALDANRARYGTPIATQIRRAITLWLAAGGLEADTRAPGARRPVTKRTRS